MKQILFSIVPKHSVAPKPFNPFPLSLFPQTLFRSRLGVGWGGDGRHETPNGTLG